MHKSLKNEFILGFLHSEVVDKDKEREGWVPGLYMLLELAVGGDLFDKIGESRLSRWIHHSTSSTRYRGTRRSGQILLRSASVWHGEWALGPIASAEWTGLHTLERNRSS